MPLQVKENRSGVVAAASPRVERSFSQSILPSLTVSGKHVPKDHLVTVMGAPAPVDTEGGFVVQRILPPGHHAVDVTVLQDGKGLTYSRDMEIPAGRTRMIELIGRIEPSAEMIR